MNTATRVFSSSRVLARNDTLTNISEETLVLPVPKFYILVLTLIMLMSVLSLIYVKDLNRRLFISYQIEKKNYVQLQTDEGKLLLEQSLLAPHTKIQTVAEQNFNMQMPVAKDVVMVKV